MFRLCSAGHLEIQSDAKKVLPEVYTQHCLFLVLSIHQSRSELWMTTMWLTVWQEDFSGDKQCVGSNRLLGDLNIPRISLSRSQNIQAELWWLYVHYIWLLHLPTPSSSLVGERKWNDWLLHADRESSVKTKTRAGSVFVRTFFIVFLWSSCFKTQYVVLVASGRRWSIWF